MRGFATQQDSLRQIADTGAEALALDLDLFSRGGLEILHAIERRQYDVLTMRPVISKTRKLGLLVRALCGKCVPGLARGRRVA